MQHRVIISLASNCRQTEHLSLARQQLAKLPLNDSHYTSEHWTNPIGAVQCSEPYLNQLVLASTPLGRDELNQWLKTIECSLGRTPERRQQGIVTIDLDLLQYDSERLHPSDWQRPYVQELLYELQ